MNHGANNRRAERKEIRRTILVDDAIRGVPLGRIGNLSCSGLMLISSQRLTDDALYQIRFALPGGDDQDGTAIEIGVHEQWTEQASVPGQFWSGLRIIDISPDAENSLITWLEQA